MFSLDNSSKATSPESPPGSPVGNPVAESRALDRCNLLLLATLVIRGLLNHCMKAKNRMLNTEDPELLDFFVMLEKVLKHGFKASASKNILALRTPEQELWLLIERIGKLSREAEEAVACVQQLPKIHSPICKVRAWLRLAVMQKKLSDYFQLLVEAKPLIREYYDEYAVLAHETTSVVFAGSLIGVRVLDCNLYLKEDDLSRQPYSVDLTRYIKIPTVSTCDMEEDIENEETKEVKSILDQKNYLEERNRQLTANITNLKRRLLIAEIRRNQNLGAEDSMTGEGVEELGSEMDLVQISRPEELETAMALMEKDVQEKQDTIISLREQLTDVKKINMDLYQKLRNIEETGKQKEKMLTKLEKESLKEKSGLESAVQSRDLKLQEIEATSKKNAQFTDNLKLELKKKTEFNSELQKQLADLQNTNRMLEESRAVEKLAREELQTEVRALETMKNDYYDLKEEHDIVKGRATEYEKTLEEMGVHLSQSKLKMEDLREGWAPLAEAQWESDKEATTCKQCEEKFSLARRKHHCRSCGGIYCNNCSENTMPLPSSAKPVRVCDACYQMLLQRYSVRKPSEP